jgi:hypothetical protein
MVVHHALAELSDPFAVAMLRRQLAQGHLGHARTGGLSQERQVVAFFEFLNLALFRGGLGANSSAPEPHSYQGREYQDALHNDLLFSRKMG